METLLRTVQIVSSDDILGGKPRIEDRRITVQQIAEYYVYEKWSIERLEQTFDLRPAEIHAALGYYYDHKDEIDRAIQRTEEAFERTASRSDAELEEVLDSYLSTKQAAARLGLSERRIRQLCEDGTIPARKLGINWFIHPSALDNEQVKNRKPGRPARGK